MSDPLTHDDIMVLLDGLKALEAKASSDDLVMTMLTTVTCRSKEEIDQRMKERQSEAVSTGEKAKQAALVETVTILKVKLFGLRKTIDSHEAEMLFEDAGP